MLGAELPVIGDEMRVERKRPFEQPRQHAVAKAGDGLGVRVEIAEQTLRGEAARADIRQVARHAVLEFEAQHVRAPPRRQVEPHAHFEQERDRLLDARRVVLQHHAARDEFLERRVGFEQSRRAPQREMHVAEAPRALFEVRLDGVLR